ncbi:MAG: hypothetical protein AAF289_04505 [Cyanobacteria bacterium P01_A01_bin.135]
MNSHMFDFYVPHELRDAEPLVPAVLSEAEDVTASQQDARDNVITLIVAVVLFGINAVVIGSAIAQFSQSVRVLSMPQAEVQHTMGEWVAGQKLL